MRKLKFKTVYKMEDGQRVDIPALKGADGSSIVYGSEGMVGHGGLIDVVGIPDYIDTDALPESTYGLTETGWYTFVRIVAPGGTQVGEGFSVHGAAGMKEPEAGADHIDIAVRFGAAPESQIVEVCWMTGINEAYVFRAVDLAVRNLDSRATYYVYDIGEYAAWTWALTTDAAFVAGTRYYTKDGDTYTPAEVVVGEAVPADTYYVHAGVTFEGMPRNLSYMLDLIDCPVTIVLPEIEESGYGAWYELQARYSKAVSVTLRVPEGIKVSATGSLSASTGVNIMTVQYFGSDKVWRLDNTKWPDPS